MEGKRAEAERSRGSDEDDLELSDRSSNPGTNMKTPRLVDPLSTVPGTLREV